MQSWMIGMVSGTTFVGWWPILPPPTGCVLFAALALIALCWNSVVARVAGGLACGCFLGLAHGTELLQQRLLDECVGVPLLVTGVISSVPSNSWRLHYGQRQRFEFAVRDVFPSRCTGPSTLILSYYGDEKIRPADDWQFEVKLRKPWGLANPGSFNMQVWLAQQGVDGVGSVRKSGAVLQDGQTANLYLQHHRLRQTISERIERLNIHPDVSAILRAITVADKAGLDHQLWFLFQQFGVNHLLVISGLHVGMIAGVGYLLGGFLQRLFITTGVFSTYLPSLLVLFLAFSYSALAGFSLPHAASTLHAGLFRGRGLTWAHQRGL